MTDDLIDQFLAEYESVGALDADSELDAIRVAILVEDVFDIVLSDDQISPAVLGDRAALRDLLVSARSER